MNKETESSISISLEANPALLPYMPELLSDLWALGSSPELYVDILKPLNLPADETKILDLGCGKGAAAVTLAKEFGFKALGIDATTDFLNDARKKAEEFKVSHLCEFVEGDIRKYVNEVKNFDIVIYASLGGILGKYDECVGSLRKTIRPGGYILIDDGFLKEKTKVKRQGYEHYYSHNITIKQLTSHGDVLLREVLTIEETKTMNEEYLTVIKKRAEKLIKRSPQLKELVTEYIDNQKVECEVLDQFITGAIWLLNKAD